jgi:hypothetical protein
MLFLFYFIFYFIKINLIKSHFIICRRKYASFVNRFVRRGRYWTEGCALKITLTQDAGEDEAVLGVVARGGLDLYVMHTPPIFNKHQFTHWNGESAD